MTQQSARKKSGSARPGQVVTRSATTGRFLSLRAASSSSAFNYYASNAEEREAASARFRADVRGTLAKKTRTRSCR